VTAWKRSRSGLILPRHRGGLCSVLAVTQLAGFGAGGAAPPPAQPLWNPSDKDADVTLSSGDLVASMPGSTTGGVRSTVAVPGTARRYVEAVATATSGDNWRLGVATAAYVVTAGPAQAATEWAIGGNGNKINNGSVQSYGTAISNGDIVMLAVDLLTSSIWWGLNGAWFASGDPAAGTNAAYTSLSGPLYVVWGRNGGGGGPWIVTLSDFTAYTYSPPTGFLAGW
jgi:hypothetical protein